MKECMQGTSADQIQNKTGSEIEIWGGGRKQE